MPTDAKKAMTPATGTGERIHGARCFHTTRPYARGPEENGRVRPHIVYAAATVPKRICTGSLDSLTTAPRCE